MIIEDHIPEFLIQLSISLKKYPEIIVIFDRRLIY